METNNPTPAERHALSYQANLYAPVAGALEHRLDQLDAINRQVSSLIAASDRTPPYKGKTAMVDRMIAIHREVGLLLARLELDLVFCHPAAAKRIERRRAARRRKALAF